MFKKDQLEMDIKGTSFHPKREIFCTLQKNLTESLDEITTDCPIEILCVNVDENEDMSNTCHVPLALTKSETLELEKTKTSRIGVRKKFGSFGASRRGTCCMPTSTRNRASLPVNAVANGSEMLELRKNLKEAYKASRQNSIVPQVFFLNSSLIFVF
ncbi:hypothetical protein JTE90_013689 [Oedothorax gibbosus]|uniref:Uncharacterized protein n=1 Tax=Oedothorax gibbosus TaxID=931172 RepID=A0AAV6UG53_9ARAC|nr:hypothetical protein JTE90_013689 [Oedothorax gibbosus]